MSKLFSLLGLMVVSAVMGWYSLWLNEYAVTPDVAGLACAAEHLANTGNSRTYPTQDTTFEMCWRPTTYPVLQQVHAGLLKVLPVSAMTLVEITTVLGFVSCVLLVWWLVYLLSQSLLAANIGGILAISTPALVRSLVLTPQNLFGYALVLIIVLCLIYYLRKPAWWWLLLAVATLALTNYVHVLSFSVGFIVIAGWVCLVLVERWWLRVTLVLSAGVLLASQLQWHWLPKVLGDKLDYFISSPLSGIDNPWWNHPSIWGYLITALAIVGLAVWPLTAKQRWAFGLLIMVPFLLGHAEIIGVGLLPNRFIPFAWLALTPLAALGTTYLLRTKELPAWLRGGLAGMILVSQLTHALVFIQNDISGLSYRYRPRTGYTDALTWLSNHDATGELLGVQSAENQEILLAPLWYNGHTQYYPWYALDHHHLEKFAVANASSPYAAVVTNPLDPNYQWLHDFYTIVVTPTAADTTTAISRQNLDYLLIPKKSKMYKQIWSAVDTAVYPILYQSDDYVIYDLAH